jgi:hypothetical protein
MTKYEIAKKTLEQLNQFYPAGLYEWLFQYRKSKYNKLVQLESGIDEVMLNGTEDEMKDILDEYWSFHKTCIEDFSNNYEAKSKLNYARKKLNEKRINA